jgi:hypothetical protein
MGASLASRAAAPNATRDTSHHIKTRGSGQRSVLFEIQYPSIEPGLQPRHRFMSAYEQRVEAPDKRYQYVLFAAEPYETIGFKVPNRQTRSSHSHIKQTHAHSDFRSSGVCMIETILGHSLLLLPPQRHRQKAREIFHEMGPCDQELHITLIFCNG